MILNIPGLWIYQYLAMHPQATPLDAVRFWMEQERRAEEFMR